MFTTHVFPIDDLFSHTTEGIDGFFGKCDCEPVKMIMPNGNMVVTHHSYDGQEIIEAVNNRKIAYIQ